MKTIPLVFLILAVTAVSPYPVHAGIRCGNDIISIGDASFEVMVKLRKCGEVLDKEVVRKETIIDTDEKDDDRKIKKEKWIENWYIRVKERGGMYCYPLSFEEGRLQSIGKWARCD